MTLSGVEPATFRFVAQHLNHRATAVPLYVLGLHLLQFPRSTFTVYSWLSQSCSCLDYNRMIMKYGNYKKVKWSLYRPCVAQRLGRVIALLFHDRGTRTGWVVSSKPRPHFTPGKDPVPILQEAWWAPGPVWTGGKSRPHRDSIPDCPACSQSLYRLSYPAHKLTIIIGELVKYKVHNGDVIFSKCLHKKTVM